MRQTLYTLSLICCLVGLGASATAQTVPTTGSTSSPTVTSPKTTVKTTSKQKDKLIFLLSGYEFFPKRTDLNKIGNEAQVGTLLLSIAQDLSLIHI